MMALSTGVTVDDSPQLRVFVSYSHDDEALVKPVVALLRLGGASTFLDRDSIPPGKQWRIVIDEGIRSAVFVLVFWCSHAAKSDQVKREYELAIQSTKDIVPVLLDHEILPTELSGYQWIDFRETAIHEKRSRQSLKGAIFVGPLMALFAGLSWWGALSALGGFSLLALLLNHLRPRDEPEVNKQLARRLYEELSARASHQA